MACEMRETRRADLAAVRLVGAIRHEIHAELALRRFDARIDFAGRHVETFGVELEVMDERFHRALHLAPLRRRDFLVRASSPALGLPRWRSFSQPAS